MHVNPSINHGRLISIQFMPEINYFELKNSDSNVSFSAVGLVIRIHFPAGCVVSIHILSMRKIKQKLCQKKTIKNFAWMKTNTLLSPFFFDNKTTTFVSHSTHYSVSLLIRCNFSFEEHSICACLMYVYRKCVLQITHLKDEYLVAKWQMSYISSAQKNHPFMSINNLQTMVLIA